MRHYIYLILSVLFIAFSQNTQLAAADSVIEQIEELAPVKVSLFNEEESIQEGHSFWLITRLKLDKGWHAYWKNPGDGGMAPTIKWHLPEGFTASEADFPYPQKFVINEMVGYGYEDEVLLLTKITPPSRINLDNVNMNADISWVVCSDSTCLPGNEKINMSLSVKNETPLASAQTSEIFAKARNSLPKESPKLQAKQEEQQIALLIPHQATKAEFFPDADQNLDFKREITIEPSKDTPGHHVLTLPTQLDHNNSQLKGVLVTEDSQSKQVYLVDVPIEKAHESIHSNHDFEGGVALAILFAFLGGMILNLMPCVLPVMSFKVLGFVKMAGQSRSLTLKHGLMFALGVLVSFWALATALLLLQAYGHSVGWGFQLQEPLFVAGLASVLLIFGLSLFGVFELGTSLASKAGQAQTATVGTSGLVSSFMSGVLATAVATPCTGPFLGTAIGFAVTLPAYLSMLIFTSLGLGMAFPYLLLAAYPKLLRFMPKPGAWMETFKEMMGFLMLASVLWLIWVFSAQTNYMAVTLLLAGFFVMAVGCWIYGKWGTPIKARMTRVVSYVVTAACFLLGADIVYTSTTPWVEAMGEVPAAHASVEQKGVPGETWEPFSAARVAELQKKGIPVFIDFTAKWCLICQTNHLTLSMDSVKQEFMKKGVVKMKADWTKRDPEITEALKKFGRNGVPLYVYYNGKPQEKPEILPQVLTPDLVLDMVKKDHLDIVSHDD